MQVSSFYATTAPPCCNTEMIDRMCLTLASG